MQIQMERFLSKGIDMSILNPLHWQMSIPPYSNHSVRPSANFNIGHDLFSVMNGFRICHVWSLWSDLSGSTKHFEHVTLTMIFDLNLKNFNICFNYCTVRGRAFIIGMCSLRQEPFDSTENFEHVTLTLTYSWKTFILVFVITIALQEVGLSHLACVYLTTRIFW